MADWKRVTTTESVNIIRVKQCKENEAKCLAAKQDELEKLKLFKVYSEVQDLGMDRISTTWVLWKKGDVMRARLVARGFEEDGNLERDSPTVAKSTIRALIAFAATRGWRLVTTDIKSAFLQGDTIDRDVFIDPPPESDAPRGTVWKLKKALYGLVDAARQFYQSVRSELIQLGMLQSTVDPSMFYWKCENKVCGILVTHIDDFLHCGTAEFDNSIMNALKRRFSAGRMEISDIRYIGFHITEGIDGIVLDQSEYVQQIEGNIINPARAKQKTDLLNKDEQRNFRGLVGQCNWAVQGTRPDMAFEMVDLSTRFKNATVADLLKANRSVTKLKRSASFILFPDLADPLEWSIVTFSDASLSNMSDGFSSTGGHIVILNGSNERCVPLAWNCGKLKRVVKSTLAAEALSLNNAIDHAIYLRVIVSEFIGTDPHNISITSYVDNKSLTQAIYSTKTVDDKRLRIDIAYIKQLVEEEEVKQIIWIPGNDISMIANVLTKTGASGASLLQVFQSGCLPFSKNNTFLV